MLTLLTIDLIVQEAIRSFELNIAVFDEIQMLSEQGKLVPTLGNNSKKVKVGSSSSSSWPTLLIASTAAAAVGAFIYARYYQRS